MIWMTGFHDEEGGIYAPTLPPMFGPFLCLELTGKRADWFSVEF
jgi:hypothetical protein